MRAKAYCGQLSYATFGPEVHEQMFRSGGQSDAKPPVLSSQASLASALKSFFVDVKPRDTYKRLGYHRPFKRFVSSHRALCEAVPFPRLVCGGFFFI
ncbi:hypothetical protein TNCV_1156721 [Trichonephila clavipes]|nr:hypothetical protein TNCV_1156721 [Trichonephila clavipes]